MNAMANAPDEVLSEGWADELEENTLASARSSPPPLDLPPIPAELVLQPGSFTVSTFSVVMMLFFVGMMVLTLALSGLIAGLGLGLAMLSMLV